jgi:nucleotide-binding universal stress UspA family protein
MKKKILVAVGLSKIAPDLISFCCAMGRRLDAQVDFLHVLPPIEPWVGYKSWISPEMIEGASKEAREKLRHLVGPSCPVDHEIFVDQGSTSEKIIERAKNGGYQLIVVGHKGDNPLVEIVVGSTAASVARYAPCSVLIFRPGMDLV